jgi:hypothetical protein
MANISQSTVVAMINVFEYLGCYDNAYSYSSDGPIITATELRKHLFSLDFNDGLLDRFGQWDWEFNTILPSLRAGTFFRAPSRRSWNEDAESADEVQERAETILRALAAALILFFEDRKIKQPPEFSKLAYGLRKDGLTFSGGKIIESETEVVDVPAELSAFERSVDRSKHNGKVTVLHHLKIAERQMTLSEWGPASGEWRNVFEESLRGVWRLTTLNNGSFETHSAHPPFKDVLTFLNVAGFLLKTRKVPSMLLGDFSRSGVILE